jgi:lipopolysaccharide/colanic/teichoic acid biosynthesis glycosyltransferase
MMELDLAYVAKKTLLLDLKIMIWTIPAILFQVWDLRGAQRAPVLAHPAALQFSRTSN